MNPMLALAQAECHKPLHKRSSAPCSRFKPKGNKETWARLFLSKWKGGTFTTADIRAVTDPDNLTGRDSARRTASFLTVNGWARAIGKQAGSNTTLFELTGEKP